MERPWTIREVSEQTGIPEATLRYYVHKGTGPRSFKIGARRVFKPSDVETWLDEQYASSASEAS